MRKKQKEEFFGRLLKIQLIDCENKDKAENYELFTKMKTKIRE